MEKTKTAMAMRPFKAVELTVMTSMQKQAGGSDRVGDGIDRNCDGHDGMDYDGDGFASEVSGGADCDE